MRPLLLKGHERPLTCVKYNNDGDLLVTCAKDPTPTLWRSDTGLRLGTFDGHNGAVLQCDMSFDSKILVTGSADTTVKFWGLQTGELIQTIDYKQPARSVAFSQGDKFLATTTDPFMGEVGTIHIHEMDNNLDGYPPPELFSIRLGPHRINRVLWGPLNKTLISGGEDGIIRVHDAVNGNLVNECNVHDGKTIMDLKMSEDKTHFISSSIDKTARVFDAVTLEELKCYDVDRPVNAAIISPILEHIILGGGQDAMSVTTTHSKAGKFDAKVFHKIYQTEIGGIKGHFGPINALGFHPGGRSFATGGEDGYVRLHTFDPHYFKDFK